MRTILGSVVMIFIVVALHPAIPGNLGEEALFIGLLYVGLDLLPVVGDVLLSCRYSLILFGRDGINAPWEIVELVGEELRRRI